MVELGRTGRDLVTIYGDWNNIDPTRLESKLFQGAASTAGNPEAAASYDRQLVFGITTLGVGPLVQSGYNAVVTDDSTEFSQQAGFGVIAMTGEISYDVVMDADNSFAEGSYRVGDGGWQVFIVSKRDVREMTIKPSTWDSGATGVVIKLPRGTCLDKKLVERLLSAHLNVSSWVEVRGPDSMTLR